jgi:hypothetical protein
MPWQPYNTCHRNLLDPIGLFWPNAHNTKLRIIATGYQQSTMMMGHKDGSHNKKKKVKQSEILASKRAMKKRQGFQATGGTVTTAIEVTQSPWALVVQRDSSDVAARPAVTTCHYVPGTTGYRLFTCRQCRHYRNDFWWSYPESQLRVWNGPCQTESGFLQIESR